MSAAGLATTISYQLGWPLRVIGIVGSLGLLLVILELVRRRQLKEEYTVLWVLTGVVLLLLAAWEGALRTVAEAIGASSEASMLYFFGLIFVVFLLLHFSVRVSRLERRVVSLMQEIALLGTANRDRLRASADGAPNGARDAHASTREGAAEGRGGAAVPVAGVSAAGVPAAGVSAGARADTPSARRDEVPVGQRPVPRS
jgi:hypothetical protein